MVNEKHWKPEITSEILAEFDEWCKYGIENYKNFPVGRTDKLSPSIIAQFIEHKFNVSKKDALHSEFPGSKLPHWYESIRSYWIKKYY